MTRSITLDDRRLPSGILRHPAIVEWRRRPLHGADGVVAKDRQRGSALRRELNHVLTERCAEMESDGCEFVEKGSDQRKVLDLDQIRDGRRVADDKHGILVSRPMPHSRALLSECPQVCQICLQILYGERLWDPSLSEQVVK